MLKTQYLQTGQASQMKSVSLSLIELQVVATAGIEKPVAYQLVRKSQFFIEWSVPTINLDTYIDFATELLSLERQLSRWKLNWSELWNSESER